LCHKGKIIEVNDLEKEEEMGVSGVIGEEEANEMMGVQCFNEERNLEMMISGGDYSPNSHTFFKHPFANKDIIPITTSIGGKTMVQKQTQ
jgi:hypothetical protein